METRVLDGNTFRRMLCGGANGIRTHIEEINELNVFPVPDGDTGTNMSKTIDSGVLKISEYDSAVLGNVANEFAKGSLFGARGNSGVILSQFFAGICEELSDKSTATVSELSDAYMNGVKRSYSAVSNPVEGTILTVFRESAEYAHDKLTDQSTLEDFLKLNIEQAERSLEKTKEILPVLTEADVVDSGGAGYLCIAKGMYASLSGEQMPTFLAVQSAQPSNEINYDLFTSDTVLEYGYCTECLVRLQHAKTDISAFDAQDFAKELEEMGCNSVVSIKDGDVLKVHAHTMTPADILTLCQRFGEFLNIKIENMCLQHSEKESEAPKKRTIHKRYGVVTVATGEGMKALLLALGADVIIDGGQTGNPAAEQFLEAFEQLDADHILVFPNNGNILLTALQAAELWRDENVTVIPTKTIPEGYAALSVFNSAVDDIDAQINDLISAKDAVVSGELTVAIRDSIIGGVEVREGEYIGILDGELVASDSSPIDAMCAMIDKTDDLDDRELITLFVGEGVDDEARVEMADSIEDRYPDHAVEVRIGGQKIYDYLIAIE
ncbi:MAG: DAK2 domain-containing protein [Ruminococcaceae bacterium]|nr:DAK2 domain-containing protein [Oscillospiraceae bacterium]